MGKVYLYSEQKRYDRWDRSIGFEPYVKIRFPGKHCGKFVKFEEKFENAMKMWYN